MAANCSIERGKRSGEAVDDGTAAHILSTCLVGEEASGFSASRRFGFNSPGER